MPASPLKDCSHLYSLILVKVNTTTRKRRGQWIGNFICAQSFKASLSCSLCPKTFGTFVEFWLDSSKLVVSTFFNHYFSSNLHTFKLCFKLSNCPSVNLPFFVFTFPTYFIFTVLQYTVLNSFKWFPLFYFWTQWSLFLLSFQCLANKMLEFSKNLNLELFLRFQEDKSSHAPGISIPDQYPRRGCRFSTWQS